MTHGYDQTNGNFMLAEGYAPEEKRKSTSSYVQLRGVTYEVWYTHINHDRDSVEMVSVQIGTGIRAINITDTADHYGITADLIELL